MFNTFRDFFKTKKVKQRKVRGFDGAKSSRLIDFFSSTLSADDELRWDLRTLRSRCRDLARNNDYAKRFVQLMKTNVIGERGVILQSNAKNPDGSDDRAANQFIEQEWEAWGRKGNCTVDGKLSLIDAQDLVMELLSIEGEVLIQFMRSNKNPWGFALKFLDNDLLDEDYNDTLSNGHQIRMGVEHDNDDKVVAYWLWDYSPHATIYSQRRPSKRKRVNAKEILHIYKMQRPGQSRGIPPMATALLDLKQLNGYMEAELVAARIASAKMGFFSSPRGDEYNGEDVEDTYNPVMSAEPGTFEQLPDGMNFMPFDPQHPTGQFAAFIKQILRSVASGLNISYANLANDLESVNYSSIRQGALEERHQFKKEQRFIVEHFLQPIYEAWLEMAMLTGKVTLPFQKFNKFAYPKWLPRGFGYIDPLKETQSYIAGLNGGILTLSDVASIHGKDVKTLFEELKKEKELAEQMGITMAYEPFGSKPQFAEVKEDDSETQ